MIDPLCLTLCSYFTNALGFDTLLIQLNDKRSFSWLFAIFFCGIEETGNSFFFSKSTLIYLSNGIEFAVFSFKMARILIFFPGGHPRRSGVTLTRTFLTNRNLHSIEIYIHLPLLLQLQLLESLGKNQANISAKVFHP